MAATQTKPIDLYSVATPNGVKIAIALEEMGVPYEPHKIDIFKNDQFTEEFIKINPNSKIPAIVDPEGPNGEPISIWESGAILLYLSDKFKKLIPEDPALRYQTIVWLFFQVAGFGPIPGQLNHFKRFARGKVDDIQLEYGTKRYHEETKRLLTVLDKQLEGKEYLVADQLTIADVANFAWARSVRNNYGETELFDFPKDYPNVNKWIDNINARPAVQKGLLVTPF